MDFTANLAGGTAESVNFDLSGQAFLVAAADFGNSTGNIYVDTVLIPMVQSKNATSLFFIHGSGIVPESTGGSGDFFPQMPIQAVIVGMTTDTPGINPIYNLLFDE